MRAALILAMAALLAPAASSATVDPSEVWRPLHAFIGTWKGTRTGTEGATKVTRTYASATANHHLEITEKNGGHAASVWGIVSFDPQREALVLRQFVPDGSAADVVYDPAASTAEQLVFASGATEGTRMRVTYQRSGWNAFVERIEYSAGSGPFAVVSETKFERKN